MYTVQPNAIRLEDGSEVFTFIRDVVGLRNTLQVEAGTTGLVKDKEGSARTYFRICDYENSSINVRKITDGKGHYGFEMSLTGNSELESVIRALKFITKVLEDEMQEVVD